MITVSTKRFYSLGKIEASLKGLAITSNLSSGKEVEGTGGGGVVRGGFMFHVFFYLPILMVGFFMISPPPPPLLLSQPPQKASVTIYFLTQLPEGCRYINLLQFLLSNSISLKNSKYADG